MRLKLKRYHIVILREDGKQYHNSILDLLCVRKRLIYTAILALLLIFGNLGFLYLMFRQGSLVIENKMTKNELSKTKDTLVKVKDDLVYMQEQLNLTEQRIFQLEKLAKEQNLVLPKLTFAGTGGKSENSNFREIDYFNDPQLNKIYNNVLESKENVDKLAKEAEKLDDVLNPHLLFLSRKPSIWPVKGFISSGFGGRPDPMNGAASWHQGVDISAPYASPVMATADGIVVSSGWQTGLGNTIVINHGNGFLTLYGHLSKSLVKPGQKVKRWQKIGLVGSTGRSTGNHCHYEIHINSKPVNPTKFMLY
jgi:murein DD-endopeptidase MepM/ murein hydrolase activator NlpD